MADDGPKQRRPLFHPEETDGGEERGEDSDREDGNSAETDAGFPVIHCTDFCSGERRFRQDTRHRRIQPALHVARQHIYHAE